jgi:hypothetical protein
MNTELTSQQKGRLTELSDASRDLMQIIQLVYIEDGHQKDLEKALGDLYAVAGHMAVEQDISWTGLCECAQKHYEEAE